MKFRKKPVVIDAIQWTGKNYQEMLDFFGDFDDHNMLKGNLFINTLEGQHKADKGDWIIKGVKGEFYPCKPDIFEQTYDEVCESCNEVKELGDYNGKRYCNRCVNAEESGEEANN